MVRSIYQLLLMLGVVVGLLGQTAAVAAAPACGHAATEMHMASMTASADCMAMCDGMKSGSAPCKKMTAQCLLAMSCTAAVFLDEPTAFLSPIEPQTLAPIAPDARRLAGLSHNPEPDPPSVLA